MSIVLTQLASDDFQRPDENPLSDGGNWTTIPSDSDNLQLVGNLVELTVTSIRSNEAKWVGSALPDDQYCQITLQNLAISNSRFKLYCRGCSNLVGNCDAQIQGPLDTSNVCFIGSGVTFNATPRAGDIWRLQVIGNVQSIYQNDVLLATNTTSATSGAPSIGGRSVSGAVNDVQISAWSAGRVVDIGNLSGDLLRSGHGSKLTPPYSPGGNQ